MTEPINRQPEGHDFRAGDRCANCGIASYAWAPVRNRDATLEEAALACETISSTPRGLDRAYFAAAVRALKTGTHCKPKPEPTTLGEAVRQVLPE